jgi:hypothetical protein
MLSVNELSVTNDRKPVVKFCNSSALPVPDFLSENDKRSRG